MGMLRWPVPAVLGWTLAWAVFWALGRVGAAPGAALVGATLAGLVLALMAHGWWRRCLVAGGFPLALLVSGAAVLPAWTWLLLLVTLLLLYPLGAWRDAPLFPTPAGALLALARHAPLAPQARVLDAGCGLGHGLRALRAAYPAAQLHGTERSWPLRIVCGLLCPWARIRQGDLWADDWSGFQLVYLFQRPESMPRAAAKAHAEMAAGTWLASLEFEAREWVPAQAIRLADGRTLWLYQLPGVVAAPTQARRQATK